MFDRYKRKLRLTEAGVRFLANSKAFLDDIEQTFCDIRREFSEMLEDPIRIGFSDGQEPFSIKKIVRLLEQSFPNTIFEIEIENRLVITEKLLNGELDMCSMVDTENLHFNKNISYRKRYHC